MFDIILECEMNIVWRYREIVCKAYPLADIDTIREDDGSLNPCSVLANVVYGYTESTEDALLDNVTSVFDDFIITIKDWAIIQTMMQNEPLPKQCHLWKYTSSKKQMKVFPEKVLHKISQLIVLIMIPIRFGCFVHEDMLLLDNVLAISVALMTTMHFLFYCRGMKFVGPFVLMVYKIIIGDMLRFLLIYSVFIISFAEAFYVIFHSCELAEQKYQMNHGLTAEDDYEEKFENIMNTPWEALMRMFIMSVGEFGAFYKNLNDCKSSIALQGKWAQVILMLEQSLSSSERLLAMFSYSRPICSDKRRRAFVVRLKSDKAEPVKKVEFIRKKQSIRLSQNTHFHATSLLR
uniref:Ion_trans domain-containing protein n=1 Tax=Heterorhabditis bacteriophora TaxID=37862 RepID=A0A1I7XTZ4_HETBA